LREDGQREFEEFITDVTPNVMTVLLGQSFFDLLEKEIFPDGSTDNSVCRHDFSRSKGLLMRLGHDVGAVKDVIAVMQANGGFCDCEIVLNVAPESRVRKTYWKDRRGKLVNGTK
jgi:hypothetical protein